MGDQQPPQQPQPQLTQLTQNHESREQPQQQKQQQPQEQKQQLQQQQQQHLSSKGRPRRSEINLALYLWQRAYNGQHEDLREVIEDTKIKQDKKWLGLTAHDVQGLPILIKCIKGSLQQDDESDHLECVKVTFFHSTCHEKLHSFFKWVCLPVCMSVCLSVCLSVCISVSLTQLLINLFYG